MHLDNGIAFCSHLVIVTGDFLEFEKPYPENSEAVRLFGQELQSLIVTIRSKGNEVTSNERRASGRAAVQVRTT
jgi:hypothetical protein